MNREDFLKMMEAKGMTGEFTEDELAGLGLVTDPEPEPEPAPEPTPEPEITLANIDPSTLDEGSRLLYTAFMNDIKKREATEKATLIASAGLSKPYVAMLKKMSKLGASTEDIASSISEFKSLDVTKPKKTGIRIIPSVRNTTTKTETMPKLGSKEWGAFLAGKTK